MKTYVAPQIRIGYTFFPEALCEMLKYNPIFRYSEPRVRVLDPTLLICHKVHELLDMCNESVELDLPF